LATYGLYSAIQFPTRITNSSASTIDSIFINTVKFNDFIVHPLINGMSDHDAQFIVLHDIIIQNESNYFCFTRKFNKSLALDFNFKLTCESWDSVFSYNDVNLSFSNFLNTYLRIFNSSFPMNKIHYTSHTKAWLTQGIKISYINKRKLFLNSCNSNDSEIKIHYKKYCRILTDVIKLAKKIHYNNLLVNSSNKIKIMWNIINGNINKRPRRNDISFININGTKTYNSQVIANTFNTYFMTLAQHMYTENLKNSNSAAIVNNPLNYLHDAYKQTIPHIKFKFVSPKEIEDDVNSLKVKDSYGYDRI